MNALFFCIINNVSYIYLVLQIDASIICRYDVTGRICGLTLSWKRKSWYRTVAMTTASRKRLPGNSVTTVALDNWVNKSLASLSPVNVYDRYKIYQHRLITRDLG